MFAWLYRLDRFFPVRYSAWLLCGVGLAVSTLCWFALGIGGLPALGFLFLVGLGFRDLHQSQRSVLRNYPVIGHLRFLLEFIRPEIRQYFIEGDNDAAPFSRQQRSLVYQRSKGDSDKRPFGTQLDVAAMGYEWINHSLVPSQLHSHDFRVVVGPTRAQPYSASVFNISAMSFGALSANAILALKLAQAAVSNDSGLVHVAAAIGTPTIGIFGPTSPWHWAPLNPPAATIETVTDVPCRPCHKPVCRMIHHRCMRDIPADQVLQAVQRALMPAGVVVR